MKKTVFLSMLIVFLASFSYAAVTVPQKGSMNLNLELTDPGGIDTVTDTVIFKHLKASEIEPFIEARLSKYGAVQTDDALNMLIITDMQPKVNDLVKIATKLDVPGLKNFLRLETIVIPVKNIQASVLVNLIRDKLSREAVIKTDDNSNTLVITDVKSKINEAMTLIRQLDVPVKQVMIEAKIVELQDDSDSKIGIDWRSILQSAQGMAQNTAGTMNFPSQNNTNNFNLSTATKINYTDSSVRSTMSIQGLDTLIGILSRDGKARLLSSPRIVGSNNRQAYINTGDQIYYSNDSRSYSTNSNQSSGIQNDIDNTNTINPATYSYTNLNSTTNNNANRNINNGTINMGITMNVIPHIISDDMITMDINASISSLAGWSPNGTPIITNRSANSTITVKNGEVFIMGGLKRDTAVKSTDRVPLLGYIPFLGFFFSSEKETKVSNDVIIFISPTILSEQGKNMTDSAKEKLDGVMERSK